jgi:hypothetical protein
LLREIGANKVNFQAKLKESKYFCKVFFFWDKLVMRHHPLCHKKIHIKKLNAYKCIYFLDLSSIAKELFSDGISVETSLTPTRSIPRKVITYFSITAQSTAQYNTQKLKLPKKQWIVSISKF